MYLPAPFCTSVDQLPDEQRSDLLIMWYAREERHHDPIFDDADARPRAPDTNERAQAGALAPVVRGAAAPPSLYS